MTGMLHFLCYNNKIIFCAKQLIISIVICMHRYYFSKRRRVDQGWREGRGNGWRGGRGNGWRGARENDTGG